MDVLVAGYRSIDTAQHDFDAVVELVKGKQVNVEGVILVAHDQSREVTVLSTGDHLGRTDLGWGAGTGLVVGLFAPELLASVTTGAAGGAIAGKFVDHRLRSGSTTRSARRCRRDRRGSSRSFQTSTDSRSSRPCPARR
jgi:arylsulfatase